MASAIPQTAKRAFYDGRVYDACVKYDAQGSSEIAEDAYNVFDYTVSKAKTFFENPPTVNEPNPQMIEHAGEYTLVRDAGSSKALALGRSKGTYKAVQGPAVLDFAASLFEGATPSFRDFGTLFHGQRCFVHLQLPQTLKIHQEDGRVSEEGRGVLLRWGHDGSTAITGQTLLDRFFCENQRIYNGPGCFSLRHTDQAQDQLATIRSGMALDAESFQLMRVELQDWANTRMSPTMFEKFARILVAGDNADMWQKLDDIKFWTHQLDLVNRDQDADDKTDRSRSRFENKVKELTDYFGEGTQGAGFTKYGAVNAVSEQVDHKTIATQKDETKTKPAETAYDFVNRASRAAESAWDGVPATRKRRAERLLRTRW
jgi:hypothetical protein